MIRRRYWALAVIQKSIGAPWWDHKIVMLPFFLQGGTGLGRGETHFVDRNRWSRRLTQFLPIFEIYCTRTKALEYSEIDLRTLREGPPKNGVRIMGYTFRPGSSSGWTGVPVTNVGVTGPAAETVATLSETATGPELVLRACNPISNNRNELDFDPALN
jgi:hypothetical protein